MKKNRIVFLILCGIIMLTVAACGNSDGEKGGSSDGKTTIRFAFWGQPSEVEVQEKIVEAFEEQNNDIHVQLDHVSSAEDFETSILTQNAGGNPPDVFYAGEVQVQPYAERGLLLDLKSFAEEDLDLDNYFEPVLRAVGYEDGNLWAFPKDATPIMMYYNKDMFDEAGIDYPEPGWTWEEFEQAAKELTIVGDNGRTEQYGWAGDISWMSMYPFIYKNGGEVMDDQGNFTMNNPEVKESLEFMKSLMDKGYGPTPEAASNIDQDPLEMFNSGRTAMVIGGRWMAYLTLPLRDELGAEWGVVPYPENKSDTPTTLAFVSLAAPKTTEYPEEAWEFIKFYVSEEAQRLNGSTGLGMPVLKSVAAEDSWLMEWEDKGNIEHYTTEMESAKDLPYNKDWALLVDEIQWRQLDQFFRGKKDIDEVLETIDKEVNKEINKE